MPRPPDHLMLIGPWSQEEQTLAAALRAHVKKSGLVRRLPFLFMAMVFLLMAAGFMASGTLWFLGLIFLPLAVVFLFLTSQPPGLQPLRQFEALLRRWRKDSHRESPLLGEMQLTPLDQGKAEREARSPGGKMKKYFRRRLARVRFALADGNLLAVDLVGKVKTKAGAVVRERYEVRGRLQLNPQRYAGVDAPATLGAFQVRPMQVDARDHWCFWATLDPVKSGKNVPPTGTWRPLDELLAAVYRELKRGARG